MSNQTWRDVAKAAISDVESQSKHMDYGAFKRALFDAYPFGERKYFPYKMWCSEQAKALKRFQGEPETETKPEQEGQGLIDYEVGKGGGK